MKPQVVAQGGWYRGGQGLPSAGRILTCPAVHARRFGRHQVEALHKSSLVKDCTVAQALGDHPSRQLGTGGSIQSELKVNCRTTSLATRLTLIYPGPEQS